MFYKGGVGVKVENSWEAWWFDEQVSFDVLIMFNSLIMIELPFNFLVALNYYVILAVVAHNVFMILTGSHPFTKRKVLGVCFVIAFLLVPIWCSLLTVGDKGE